MSNHEKLVVRHRSSQDGQTCGCGRPAFPISAATRVSLNCNACKAGGDDFLKLPKIPAQNIILRLQYREIYAAKQNVSPLHVSRRLHQNACPNFTVVNVEKPPCFLRKFSPDGRHLVAFSSDQTSIEIYWYRGPCSAAHLLRDFGGDHLGSGAESAHVRSTIFNEFFRLRHIVNVSGNGGEQLNRECSLFTDDCRHVIVGSAMYVPDEPHPFFWDMHRNNESVSPNPRSPLEDYSLHLVDMVTGTLKDKRTFKTDKIFLSHNQGLYLYRDTLAVLSVQHQTVHIFKVTKEGQFVDVRTVGRFCYEDDELLVSSAFLAGGDRRPYCEPTLNSLKHRLLVHLYRQDFWLSLDMRQAFPQYIGAQRCRWCRLRLPRELGRVQTGRGRVDQLHACMPLEPKTPYWVLRAAVLPNFKSASLAARTCSVRWIRRYSLVSMLVSALSKAPRTLYRFRAQAKPSLPWPCYGDLLQCH